MMIFAFALAAALQPADEKAPRAAQTVIERYYAAIGHRQYAVAYRLWASNGRASGKTLNRFAAGFAQTVRARVTTSPPAGEEGAAGSVFVTVPVRVDSVLKDGTRQRFVGRYVLRRVNDVPGATLEQRRWHIHSAKLRAAS